MSDAADLPPPSVELHAVAHLARALEARLPGLMDDWLENLEDEATRREVIRLRGPKEAEAVIETRQAATAWVRHVRLITLAMIGARKQRKRG